MSVDLQRHVLPVLVVALGGAVGALARHIAGLPFDPLVGTLIANITGSFLLGVVLYEAMLIGWLSDLARRGLATGVLGSFTTYSTFIVESLQASPWLLVGNVTLTYAGGFVGILFAKWLVQTIQEAPG